MNITTAGKKHLGAAIGTIDYREEFMTSLVRKWVDQIETLSKIAAFEPRTAYVAFTSCIRHRYTYYMRTIPNISQLLEPLEQVIRTKFLPALLEGRSVTDDERKLLSLPPRLGGWVLLYQPEFLIGNLNSPRVPHNCCQMQSFCNRKSYLLILR